MTENSSLVPQKCQATLGTWCEWVGQPLSVTQNTVLCIGFLSSTSFMMFNLLSKKKMLSMCCSKGRFFVQEGNQVNLSDKTISLPGVYCIV